MKRTAYAALTGAVVLLSGCGALSQVNQGATGAPSSSTKPAATSSPTPTAARSAAPTPTPSATRPLAKSRTIYWATAKPGMCLLLPDDDYNVTRTDCRAKHDAEVMVRARLHGGAWPGEDAVDEQALKVCGAAFPRYVGVALDESLLDVDYISADRAGWEDGDRSLICLVYDPNEEWTTRALKASRE
ncbi:MAG TPA: septum formation family protein [Ornithinibacter sp.]|nr:septum formation family protein [Ornithinibacter sp.]